MKIFLLLLCPFFSYSQQEVYKNLALEGGGVRGMAYAGAFKVLEEKGILKGLENVAGSSAGAITGLMLCIGYNSAEIDSILMSLPFQQFNDGKWGLYGKYKRIKRKYGIYKGEKYERWLREMLVAKTGNADLTFRQLHEMKTRNSIYKDLYCTGTNISRQRLEIFSYKNSPDLSLATAVRISGGIPIYFTPIALDDSLRKIMPDDKHSYINYYVDGGLLCNYPISMFDSCKNGGVALLSDDVIFNQQTLGIKLERPEQIEAFLHDSTAMRPFQPKNIYDYMTAFTNLVTETLVRKYPGLQNEKGRTIYISYGNTNSKIKKMSKADKELLYANGVAGAKQFFNDMPLPVGSAKNFP